jgi:hypothetical protein
VLVVLVEPLLDKQVLIINLNLILVVRMMLLLLQLMRVDPAVNLHLVQMEAQF